MRGKVVLSLFVALLVGADKPAKLGPLDQFVVARVEAIFKQVDTSHDYSTGLNDAQALLDQAIAFSKPTDQKSIPEAAYAVRLLRQSEAAHQEAAEQFDATWAYLRKHDSLARKLAFTVREDVDKIPQVYQVLTDLVAARKEDVAKFENLTVALCVVYDRKVSAQLNENTATSSGALPLFDYYSKADRRLFYGIKNVPPELLVYVVSTTASPDELQWALNLYAGKGDVGARFFEIEYDYDHYLKGSEKKLTRAGFNLPNIKKFGGVCVDQAYFAETVAQAIGIPATIAGAQNGEGGHAWVGFLTQQNNKGFWNFNAGRYPEYQGLRGNVQEPQSGHTIGDGRVALLGEMISVNDRDRQRAAAFTDAAIYLAEQPDTFAPPAPSETSIPEKPRTNTVATQVDLLATAIKLNFAYSPAWDQIAKLAKDDKLTLQDKRNCSALLTRVCGQKYPDFTFDVLEPMVKSIPDVNEQNQLWENAFKLFSNRLDICAAIRMQQAMLWDKANQPDKAGRCYEDILQRFPNAGHFVLLAIKKAEDKLVELKREKDIPTLYAQTWQRIPKPDSSRSDLVKSSNWYQIGKTLADKLDAAGRGPEADDVRSKLGGR